MNTIAMKLTPKEIKALPKGSVIWMESHCTTDEGIVFYCVIPVMIYIPGEDGGLIGADKNSFIDLNIDDRLFADEDITFWSAEPEKAQVTGMMSGDEYDAMSDDEIDGIVRKIKEMKN